MKTVKTLKISSYFLKFLMSISFLIAFSLAFIYFHSMFYPKKYSNLIVNKERNIQYIFDIEKAPKTYKEWESSNKLFYYVKLDNYSKFSIIWTKVATFTIFFIVLFLFDKIIRNTKNFDLFFQKNIRLINNILKLIILLFLFNFVVKGYSDPISMVFEDSGKPHFITSGRITFDFLIYYPLAIIFFYTLREVFKRGQELKQENDLTI
ncbi:Protein of unknown function [Polaribacter sp. KT25b]|uniref:DUF2975 domain-containing protein n=1 Tax=Polaribacter sp. KT25b TaxID=1855336 RepID=UPI00087BF33B|nr:DUF2975 domain-containing protein [Polaribacter sp. KT25b]SDS33598.1 Protein of unknown function [Polaribacter sp. KT25b]